MSVYGTISPNGRLGDVTTVYWDVSELAWCWVRRPGEPRKYGEKGAQLMGGTLTVSSVGREGAMKIATQLRAMARQFELAASQVRDAQQPDGSEL